MQGPDEESMTCSRHSGKQITSFCLHHQTGMCIDCLLTRHKNCINHVKPIEKVRKQTSLKSDSLVKLRQQLQDEIREVKDKKVDWIRKYDKVERDLIMGIRQRRFRIVQRVEKLASEAIDMSKSVLEEHKKMYQYDVEVLAEFGRQLDEIKIFMQGKVSTEPIITNMIEEIESSYRKTKLKSARNDVKFRFYISDEVTRLDSQCGTFGELCVEETSDNNQTFSQHNDQEDIELNSKQHNFGIYGSKNRDSKLFINASVDDEYTIANPDHQLRGTTNHTKPPPLPNMETRILSPRILSDVPTFEFTNEEEDNTKNEKAIDIGFDGQDEMIPAIEDDGVNMKNNEAEREYSRQIFFFEPAESLDTDDLSRKQSDKAKQENTGNRTRSSTPIRRAVRVKNNSPSWPMCKENEMQVASSKLFHQNEHRRTDAQTDDLVMKNQMQELEHIADDKRELPTLNKINHDSGIVISQDLSNLKSLSKNTQPSIPQLPKSTQRRKCSEPSLPVVRRKQSQTDLHEHFKISKRKSCSVTDLASKSLLELSSITATESTDDKEAIPVVKPKLDKGRRSVKRTIKSLGSSTWRGKPKEMSQATLVDITIDQPSPGQALASAILPSRIILSPDRAKPRNSSFITGLTALNGGNILACDSRNNTLELFDSYGLLRDIFEIEKPFGCCCMEGNKVAVTSQENHILRLFVIEEWKIKFIGERTLKSTCQVFGVSFSYGFICVSCLTEVKLIREQGTEKDISVRPYEKGKKKKTMKPFFVDVQYALMERIQERFYIFTSDIRKKRVTSVSLNGMVVWTQSNIETRCLVYYDKQVIVTTDRYLVFLQATSGDKLREIVYGIPKCPWGIAVENGPLPWLLVSGCGKTCNRQVMRIGLCSSMPQY